MRDSLSGLSILRPAVGATGLLRGAAEEAVAADATGAVRASLVHAAQFSAQLHWDDDAEQQEEPAVKQADDKLRRGDGR